MEKRYQVFVSSTFQDLKVERAEVMQALLELDCIPAGMELFPAANDEQWEWIKKVIRESDYYLVVVGGRYGQVHPETGQSFTEMEYRYALEAGKPVIAFLHDDPSQISAGKSEAKDKTRQKLEKFRQLCKEKLCKFWRSPDDLGAKVSRSISQLIKHEPAVGWIKADLVDEDQQLAILKLREENRVLQERVKSLASTKVNETELAGGDEVYELYFVAYVAERAADKAGRMRLGSPEKRWFHLEVTWNEIFRWLIPELLSSGAEGHVIGRLVRLVESKLDDLGLSEGASVSDLRLRSQCVDQIKVQFTALGLIESFDEEGKVHWCATERGKARIVELGAIKKGQTRARDLD